MALHFTREEFAARRTAACAALKARGLDGLLIFRQESMFYLTGYDTFGYVFFQCLYLDADGAFVLLTRAPDLRQAQHTSIIEDIRIWTDAAAHIITAHKPNLMMFHLLTLDSMQHRYGPDTLAAQETMAHLDAQVAEIVAAVRRAGILDQTTFVIVSDHGFKRVKRLINPNVALAKAGLVQVTDDKATRADAWIVPEGGSALAYVTVPDADGAKLAQVRQAVAGLEGVDKVVEPADYPSYGLPLPTVSDQMGSLFITAKPGYAFTAALGNALVTDATEGSFGAHGYVASDPELGAIFIASGRGIKGGVTLDSVRNIDVAPTLARLLGLDLTNGDGTVLTAILSGR